MNGKFWAWLLSMGAGLFLFGLGGEVPAQEKVIYLVQTSPANMVLQLKTKDIDGFIAWEPFNAQAVKEGTGRYLIQSGEIWKDHPCCVLAAAEKFKDENVLRALVWAHLKAVQFIKNPGSRGKVLEYAQQFTGKDPSVVEEALKHVKFIEYPSSAEIQKYYQGLKEGRLIRKTSSELGFKDDGGFFEDFLSQKFFREAAKALQKNPGWTPKAVPS